MRYRFHDHGLITDGVRESVDHESAVIDRRLEDFADDLKLLDVTLVHHRRDDSYTARLVLCLPDREMPADGDGPAPTVALRAAFADLSDRLDEYLAKLRGEPAIRDEQRKPAWKPPISLPVD
ncbi:MAG TPA: hypothetical protein VFN57_09430 [Thermomicrobiaceae bacterium]|nr:hypothetical protein [Thermomicrobiaceae bacterium]